jgi:hypothetical protein
VWKSFQEKFHANSDLNREENFLSSDEVVNGAGVVQKGGCRLLAIGCWQISNELRAMSNEPANRARVLTTRRSLLAAQTDNQ